MCSICNQFSCPELCPNHRGRSFYTCSHCREGICNGESYYKINGSYFHKECLLDSYDKEELLSLLGAPVRLASELEIAFYRRKNGK
ncbi:MAG: hypothetical protein IJ039_08420 [Clostridia bacterium]|nr:hypothetical protein [Clostridia bacterium]